MASFKLSNYDCIGFDLDNTLLQYKVSNLIKLSYGLLTDFLVEHKKYSEKYLKRTLTDSDFDFMQKGLVLDIRRGNILKLDANGLVWKATHGTKLLTTEELLSFYPNQRFEFSDIFTTDLHSIWNGELSLQVRTVLDYFDISVSVIFANMVDSIDGENGKQSVYDFWPDILDSLKYIYSVEKFKSSEGVFLEFKSNPEKYFHKCSSETISWIRELKKKRKTFLITGSDYDFMNFTASYAMGENWRSLFDVVVCFACKPGFFAFERPYFGIEDKAEEIVPVEEFLEGGVYRRGNWKDLVKFFTRITGKHEPVCLYFGDNIMQDVYVPNKKANCDTMVVVDEQLAERMLHHELSHTDESIINSEFWGSYFSLREPDGFKDTFWNHIIRTHAKVCIPQVNIISTIPLEQSIKCFVKDDVNSCGYYPGKPLSLHL
ncbi:5'-nucleotidase domain-containing protein 1 [Leptopilina heterotoma]|uniref:5'-nucleotidase domain-containing protein 1 n=1 Tax=Leptopilina heterotoma TaxID=63436 RepID=UPI001CA9E9FB|nr:5'-nucleotidase domain-containing protein 1 [Leptopilina heterotoma]